MTRSRPIPSVPLRLLVLLVLLLPAALAGAGDGQRADAGVPAPQVSIAQPGHCIAPVEEMRRKHMDMLKHQRDLTVRDGIRGAPVSLRTCIECHASRQTGSVLGDDTAFCQGCHSYVAVKLDCFDCHQPKPRAVAANPGEARP